MRTQVNTVLSLVSAVALLALVLGGGGTAYASVIAYEGFDYPQAVGADMGGLHGGIGWGTNPWVTTFDRSTSGTLVDGLTFSNYPVAGKAGLISNCDSSGNVVVGASRRLGGAVKTGDTLWVSFLFYRVSVEETLYPHTSVRLGTTPLGGDVQLDIKTRNGSVNDMWKPAPSEIDGAASPTWGNNIYTTYLCIVEVTNIGGAGTETMWILDAAKYDAIKAGGITREKLAANSVATATKACKNIALDASRYLQIGCGHRNMGTSLLTVDELKFATTLEEVLAPVKTPAAAPDKSAPAEAPSAATEKWIAQPLVSQATLDAGIFPGGEGGQYSSAICCDAVDGKFILYGTDVGGIFSSRDGGKLFEPCNRGYAPHGNCGFAIDPMNSKRALAVGSNYRANGPSPNPNGLYLTTDQADTWTHVLPYHLFTFRDLRESLAFDKSSYDKALGYCTVAYWSQDALYKSTDGGSHWAPLPNTGEQGGAFLRVHPTKGYLYAAGKKGLFKSSDGGKSFEKKISAEVTGIDVVNTQPDSVYICTPRGIQISPDGGKTFPPMAATSLPEGTLRKIHVSPVNIQRMVIESDQGLWKWLNSYSTDGGKTWSASGIDSHLAFVPYNSRVPMYSWSPVDEKVCWAMAGEWITKTEDGGMTFGWASNGNTGIKTSGFFNFNAANPDLLYFSALWHMGGATVNGGKSWFYLNPGPHTWGGHAHMGYAASADVFVAAAENQMRITRDRGKTFTTFGEMSGANVSCGDPADANVIFCGKWRSADLGLTWNKMEGCDGVYTCNPAGGHELYGICGGDVVKSADHGVTWATAASLGGVYDIAYDQARDRLYATHGNQLLQIDVKTKAVTDLTDRLPGDQFGSRGAYTVAVDPVDPGVVYAGLSRYSYSPDNSVCRSTDAGLTWNALTRGVSSNYIKSGPDGGRDAIAMRVNPKTRELWVGTAGYGLWRFSAPAGPAKAGSASAVSPVEPPQPVQPATERICAASEKENTP